MTKNINFKAALTGALITTFCGNAMAQIMVDKSQGQLNISSDISGLVIVKVIGPDDIVVVNDKYQGNSFSWSPSSGPDGAYRYDIRIVVEHISENQDDVLSEYAGGSVEVLNGVIPVFDEETMEEDDQ